MLNQMDEDGNGEIDYKEFKTIMQRLIITDDPDDKQKDIKPK